MKQLFLMLFFFLVSFHSFSQKNISVDLEKFLTEYYQNKSIPSISAGALKDDKILWAGSRGYSDVENLVPASPSSVYRIASVSKPITAVAIIQLYEQGKLHLDDDVLKYIPYFPVKRWKFTIRQLLNHTSGIRNYKPNEFDSKNFFSNTREAVNVVISDSLQFQPGTDYLYTTLGYNLLAAVVERISGTSFSAYLENNIFKPAGMNSTFLEVQPQIIFNRAKGYQKNSMRQLINAPLADLSIKHAGGGMISTAPDLLKFASALLTGKLIKPESLDSMITPLKLKNGGSRQYGLGFSLEKDSKNRSFISHAGGGTGFTSYLIIYPKEKVATVHLINIRDRNLNNPAAEIASILLDSKYVFPLKSFSDELFSVYTQNGIDSSIAIVKQLNTTLYKEYNTGESELLSFGNDLLNSRKYLDAIKYFKFLSETLSDNPEVFIGLGDAYNRDGNKGLAIKSYRAALKINPSHKYANDMIKKLSGN
jgi:serine beta-lactamase-like protein LACTB, mitochondrial